MHQVPEDPFVKYAHLLRRVMLAMCKHRELASRSHNATVPVNQTLKTFIVVNFIYSE
jgi:hypothetical protein